MLNKFFISYCFLFIVSFAQLNNPKFEMRGVWVAALGIDWPYTTGTTAQVIAQQKAELIGILNFHKANGMNTIFLHMRPLCDALYKSNIEPWSYYITGQQGIPPSDPNYDPLTFAIEEAHKRGMELHAWLNPYRALLSGGNVNTVSNSHVIKTHPEWIIKCQTSEYRFLDPGQPIVREYVLKVVLDIIRRYDIDGIHFDDYFYPYSDYGPFTDDSTYYKYKYGFTDKSAWRKNNVNLLLKMINDSINIVKPFIKFGISPSGNPSVNSGIYCDPSAWLQGKYVDTLGVSHQDSAYIDYILPQLYWTNFGGYLGVWGSSTFLNGRDFWIGHAAYRLNEPGWSLGELSNQVNTLRNYSTCKGSVYFSSKSFSYNYGYCVDTLRHNFYANSSIVHKMNWKPGGNIQPNPPSNLRLELNPVNSKMEFKWNKSTLPPSGDSALFYIIYRFSSLPANTNLGSNILGTTGEIFLSNDFTRYSSTSGRYFAVTAVDRYSNESLLSNVYTLDTTGLIPSKPLLVSPTNGDENQSSTATLVWKQNSKTEAFSVQVSNDSTFSSNVIVSYVEVKDTSFRFNGLASGKKYFWRVKAHGLGGESLYSDVFSFKAGFPSAPILLEPPHASTNVTLNPVFKWNKDIKATSYNFQLATSSTFNPPSTIILDLNINDTTASASNLETNKIYYWRVRGKNLLGQSDWSSTFGFKTTPVQSIELLENDILDYNLEQNYPNPFNPSTSITFSIPEDTFVELKIFDINGSEIATLVSSNLSIGKYKVLWEPMDSADYSIPSGVYVYQIKTEKFSQQKKMMFLK